MGSFSPQFHSIPAFTKVSVSQNVHLTFPWNNPELRVCLLKQKHTFPWRLFFFFLLTFVFELYTWAVSASVRVEPLNVVVLPSAEGAGDGLGGCGRLCCRGGVGGRLLAGVCVAVAEGRQVLPVPWGHIQHILSIPVDRRKTQPAAVGGGGRSCWWLAFMFI